MALKNRKKPGDSNEGVGIGVDIEDIERFRMDSAESKRFLKRVYTLREIDYCLSKADPAQHLAARFAGKEAIIKAMSGFGRKIGYHAIEIINEPGGKPIVILGKSYERFTFQISISHCKDKAVAFVLGFQDR